MSRTFLRGDIAEEEIYVDMDEIVAIRRVQESNVKDQTFVDDEVFYETIKVSLRNGQEIDLCKCEACAEFEDVAGFENHGKIKVEEVFDTWTKTLARVLGRVVNVELACGQYLEEEVKGVVPKSLPGSSRNTCKS